MTKLEGLDASRVAGRDDHADLLVAERHEPMCRGCWGRSAGVKRIEGGPVMKDVDRGPELISLGTGLVME